MSTSGLAVGSFNVRLNYIAFAGAAPSAINIPNFRFVSSSVGAASTAQSVCTAPAFATAAPARPTAAFVTLRYQVGVARDVSRARPALTSARVRAVHLCFAQHVKRANRGLG
jgi:hypothetical protein